MVAVFREYERKPPRDLRNISEWRAPPGATKGTGELMMRARFASLPVQEIPAASPTSRVTGVVWLNRHDFRHTSRCRQFDEKVSGYEPAWSIVVPYCVTLPASRIDFVILSNNTWYEVTPCSRAPWKQCPLSPSESALAQRILHSMF
jgi:hypothetical protein